MANISKIKVGNTSYGITATPTAHASTATTYGAASASNYGHVKLSDNYTSSAGAAASGIGASSLAVYNAYNTLNSNLSTLIKSADFTIKLAQQSWIKTSAGMYYIHYPIASLNGKKTIGASIIEWSWLRTTDHVFIGIVNDVLLIGSNTNTFSDKDSSLHVRVTYS